MQKLWNTIFQVQFGHGNHEFPVSVVTVTKSILHWPSQKSVGNENNAELWVTDSGKGRGILSTYVATGKPIHGHTDSSS